MKQRMLIILSLLSTILFFLFINSCSKLEQSQLDAFSKKSSVMKPNVSDCGVGYHWDYTLRRCVPDCPDGYFYNALLGRCEMQCPVGYHNDPETGNCVADDITKYFHGIPVTLTNGMLKVSDTAALNTILAALENDYETWNTNYENQYPNLTADQLDSVDQITGFDEFKPLEDFENLFNQYGFTSKRTVLESQEDTWLDNNTDINDSNDPDSADYTFDDFVNTVANSCYKFEIGNSIYTFTNDGSVQNGLVINGVANNGVSPNGFISCKGFKNAKGYHAFGNRRIFCRLAIHGLWPWGGVVKAVTKSYKQKSNGKWKRARAHITAQVLGEGYDGSCIDLGQIGAIKIKNRRKRITAKYFDGGKILKTLSGELHSFHELNGNTATLTLSW